MVANSPIERVGPGQLDYVLNRLADIERRLDQQGAKSSFPFSVGHNGIRDFSIERSASGDGTADVFIGNGAGGKLIQVITDPTYGTKIFKLLDQQGRVMMSTDALAGYGVGVPSYPFIYAGFESLNMNGATTKATGREVARGINWVYNPAVFINPRVKFSSATNETANVFITWKDGQGNLVDTADIVVNIPANVATLPLLQFGHLWDADDMNSACRAQVRVYCTSANPANVNVTASYQDGYGVSKRYYTDNAGINWTV